MQSTRSCSNLSRFAAILLMSFASCCPRHSSCFSTPMDLSCSTLCPSTLGSLIRNRKQLRIGHHIQYAIHRHRRPLDRLVHRNLAEQLLFLAMGENVNVAVFVTEIDFPVHPVGRTPDFRLEVVLPILLTGPGIEAVEITVHLRN